MGVRDKLNANPYLNKHQWLAVHCISMCVGSTPIQSTGLASCFYRPRVAGAADQVLFYSAL